MEPERRDQRSGPPDRRRYNRRSTSAEVNPPYFDVFERVAHALEGIEELLRERLPAPPERGPGPVRPRAAWDQGQQPPPPRR